MTGREISRRELLRRGAALGGAAAASRLLPSPAAASPRPENGPSILDLAASESPVDHIVVLMMENRSFDHYLGWAAQDETYIEEGRRRYGRRFGVNGDLTQEFPHPEGNDVPTYYLPTKPGEENPYRGYHHPDPGHGWECGRAQRDGGFLAEGSGNDEYALGYYLANDIPFYSQLARRFTIFDRYHCSLLGPTFPNREYMHSAQSGGKKDNSLPDGPGFEWATIWDRLAAADVPRGYYFVDLPAAALWGPRLLPITHHVERFFADCQAGTLPNVVFVDPGFTT